MLFIMKLSGILIRLQGVHYAEKYSEKHVIALLCQRAYLI